MKYNINYVFRDTYAKNTIRKNFSTTLDADILLAMREYSKATNQSMAKCIECFYHEMLSSHEKQLEFYEKVRRYKGADK